MVDLHPKTCNLCRGKVVLVPNAKVYGKSYGSGMCYLCTKCGAFVGTHEPRPDEALGLLADSRMRNTKKRCHALFDRHWSDKEQKRTCRTAMYWIILKKEDRKSKRSVGQIGRQAIIMRMRAERVIKAVDILKNGKF